MKGRKYIGIPVLNRVHQAVSLFFLHRPHNKSKQFLPEEVMQRLHLRRSSSREK